MCNLLSPSILLSPKHMLVMSENGQNGEGQEIVERNIDAIWWVVTHRDIGVIKCLV